MKEQKNYFEELNNINVQDKIEKKNGLSYLSWAWAWGELKKKYPLSYYTVYENEQGYNYFTDGKTAWVKTGVTMVDGDIKLEHIEYLPIMDFKNKSIPVENVTSFDVNKSIQRSLTKAVARHGLGLYVYAGEDLPEEERKDTKKAKKDKTVQEEPKEEKKTNHRQQLITYCREHKLNMNEIAKRYGLNGTSTDEDFKKALDELKKIESENK